MNSFTARIDTLMDRVERARLEQDIPVDPLSQSLYEYGAYLASLDDLGVMMEARELDISPGAVRRMALS